MKTSALFLSGFWVLSGFGAAIASSCALANTQLDTVTVAGTRSEISLKNNPASVSVIERKQIEQQGAASVAELLRDIPGVIVADSSAAGMQRIRMRGESSRRVTILVDGQEITDHSTFGTPILIHPSSIERIEVIRGPSSVLYGAKAIGGVINIITREGADRPLEFEVGSRWHSGSNGRQGFMAISGATGDVDYRVSASAEKHADRHVANGPYSSTKTLDNTAFDNTDLSMHLGYRFGFDKHHRVMLKANQHQLSTDSWTDPATLNSSIKEFSIKLPKRDLTKVGLYYQGKYNNSPIKRVQADTFYQWVDREFANHILVDPGMISVAVNSTSIDRNMNYGGSAQVDLNLHPDHDLIVGMQYLMDDLDTQKNTLQYVDGYLDANNQNNNHASMQTLSAFLQDTWRLPQNLNLHVGARFYHINTTLNDTNVTNNTNAKDTTNSQLVKSLGFTYTGLTHSTTRVLYSEGYIMPTLLQMYTDTSAGRGVTTYANPDLKPETSKNIELGIRYANHGLVLDSAGFYSDAQHYITSAPCNPTSACPAGAITDEFININADSAKSFGLEFQLEYHLSHLLLSPYLSGTWMRRETKQNDFVTYHSDTPLLSGKAGARYDHYFTHSELWFDMYLRGASHSSYQESATSTTQTLAGYTTLHLSMGNSMGDNGQYQWSLHLNNLFDKSYRASSNELPGTGRNVVASLQAKF